VPRQIDNPQDLSIEKRHDTKVAPQPNGFSDQHHNTIGYQKFIPVLNKYFHLISINIPPIFTLITHYNKYNH